MKNVNIEIKAIENGYIIEKSWYEPPAAPKEFGEHLNKRYMFATWSEVSDWVVNNPLDMPPK